MSVLEKRRDSLARCGALLLALAVAGLGGCVDRQADQGPHAKILPVPPRVVSDFSGPSDLLRSVQNGTFGKRVNLDQQLDDSVLPASVDVYFTDGTQVPDEQMERLEHLAGPFKSDEKLQLQLVGCSDRGGDKDANKRVSKERAEAVATQLEKLGVRSSQITSVDGKGEDCPFAARVVHVVTSIKGEKQEKLIAEGAVVKKVD